MAVTVDVDIAVDSRELPGISDFEQWINLALKNHKGESEISLRIVDKDEIQALNKHYRDKDKPTNVLAFPAEFPEGVDVPLLGDLVICAPIVIEEARAQQKAIHSHWAHMVIHGSLHLLGYDHIDEGEAEAMEMLETQLLATLGYPCPYQ
ncbi:MAG: rRNA maturation RNase YbeY [Pseudomonadota bacterium]